MSNEAQVPPGRREFVTGLVGTGVWIACTSPAEAQPPKKGVWDLWVNWRVGLPQAHLSLAIPGTIFSSLKDVDRYSFILCGHELFECTSADDAAGAHLLQRQFILEPSEHQLRIFAQTKSGTLMRQYQTLTLKVTKPKYFIPTFSCSVNPSTQIVAGELKEIAGTFKEELGRADCCHCACSVRG